MDDSPLAMHQQCRHFSHIDKKLSIGIVVPTYQAATHLVHCLLPLRQSLLELETRYGWHKEQLRLLVIDSSSTDNTVTLAQEMGAEVMLIPKEEFSHGATREKARKYLNTDMIVMVTQDAYATSETIPTLIEPLVAGHATIAYARQIPHDGAGYLETFSRQFNYPSTSHLRTIADVDQYGIYTFFCSNSCAAYLNSALDEIGGFPMVPFGEDTLAVARLLRRDHKIAYVAEAVVKHSHHYSLKEEFRRSRIIGHVRSQHREWLECGSSDEKRGLRYAVDLIRSIIIKKPYLLPYALAHLCVRWLGYHLGKIQHKDTKAQRA